MATQLQIRRGTTAQCDLFTGAEGEIVYDTTAKSIRLHDGSTAGGRHIPTFTGEIPSGGDYVVETQLPTAENNYTWYRLYNSGWVEQGGLITNDTTYTLPVTMIDTNYYVNVCWDGGKSANFFANDFQVRNLTTTTFYTTASRNGANTQGRCWEVKGIAG